MVACLAKCARSFGWLTCRNCPDRFGKPTSRPKSRPGILRRDGGRIAWAHVPSSRPPGNSEAAMTKLFLGTVAAACLALCSGASAAEIKVLAAGGMQPGLNAAAHVFRDQTGTEVKFTYEPPADLGK